MGVTGFYDVGVEGRRYMLWWSGRGDGGGGVRAIVKETCVRRWWK